MDLIEARGADGPKTRHPWETARLAILNRLIDQEGQLPAGSAAIDIGCGDAFVVRSLAGRFPAVTFYGIDSGLADTPPAGTVVSPNLTLFRSLDDLPATPAPRASLVLLMDVLEHIDDDRGFLANLMARPFMSRDTTVIITVPAYQSLFSSHDRFLKHFRRYSNGSLRRLIRGAGLRESRLGYLFAALLPIRGLQVIKERLLGPAATTATGLRDSDLGRLTAAVVARMLVADASVALALRRFGINLPGLSNYAVCRRSA